MSALQDLRYKLQKRVSRLGTTDANGFSPELMRFFDFFEANPTLRSAAAELLNRFPLLETDISDARQRGKVLEGATEAESAALGLRVLRIVARQEANGLPFMEFAEQSRSLQEMLDGFRDRFLTSFYEYIDEQIEDRNVVLGELIRFKHLAEWFRREQLWSRFKSESRAGERTLAFALYEFLYQQGIDFHIEPASASGEADMVSAQHSKHPLVADVKVFDPASSRGAAYITRGFHQVFRYLNDFNQPIGFLIVFKATEKHLDVEGAEDSDEAPKVTIGDKTIFLVQIDIFPHDLPASKRPITEVEVISQKELRSQTADD